MTLLGFRGSFSGVFSQPASRPDWQPVVLIEPVSQRAASGRDQGPERESLLCGRLQWDGGQLASWPDPSAAEVPLTYPARIVRAAERPEPAHPRAGCSPARRACECSTNVGLLRSCLGA